MIDKSMNVLIVDDYKTMLRIIRNLLKQIEFHNVEEASDGSEALSKLRGGQFGLVISDWNMQPMTGLQLLQEQRTIDGELQIRHGGLAAAVAAQRGGEAFGYLQVPLRGNEVEGGGSHVAMVTDVRGGRPRLSRLMGPECGVMG